MIVTKKKKKRKKKEKRMINAQPDNVEQRELSGRIRFHNP